MLKYPMIKAITFDLDGVYFLGGKDNFIVNLKKKYGIEENEAKRVFFESEEMNNLYKKGAWTDEQFWEFAKKEWHLEVDNQELIDLLIEGYSVNEPVVELIKKLRNRDYRILACSNNFPARVNGLSKRFGFLVNFDTTVFSYQVGCLKPDKEMFENLIIGSGCSPEEIVMSDDDPSKITSAKELGINTFVYENFDQFVSQLKNLGVNIL